MAYYECGDPANPRVLVCVHGLTRSGPDFDVLAQALQGDYRVVCPDVVGRGASDWLAQPLGYGVPQYVADMVTLLARLDVEKVNWFGTSMGGLIGMTLEGLKGAPIGRMLINDVGPRLDLEGLARIGSYVGKAPEFASRAEGLAYLVSRAESFGKHTPEQWEAINTPLLKERNGKWVVHYDPAIAAPFAHITSELAAAGEAALWKSWESIQDRMLIARGANSDLLSAATAAEMIKRGREVSMVEIADTGHTPTFVQPGQEAIASDFFLGK
ncbi:MAG: alpha/beta fold hydrolase [Candidatus Protistobacter heckmanni]|nr:alpha/beta fold hydrolase [Candidatus Protistobacter heckmanni]